MLYIEGTECPKPKPRMAQSRCVCKSVWWQCAMAAQVRQCHQRAVACPWRARKGRVRVSVGSIRGVRHARSQVAMARRGHQQHA